MAPTQAGYDAEYEEQLDPSLVTPVNPPSPVDSTGSLTEDELASVPTGSVNVDQLVCLVPTQTTASATNAQIANGDSALYANSASNTDTIVRPTAGGETIIEVGRGSGAPQSFTWQVGIPAGYVMQELPDGGVAVLDPYVPAPSGETVPSPPAGTQDPNRIADVATQLAETDYQIASAEVTTGKSVIAVIPRPYFVDSSGAAHAGTLDVTSPSSLVASGGSYQRALVMKILAKRRAPSGAHAYFMTDPPSEVAEQAYRFAGTFANTQPNERRVLYLDWGSAHKFADQYGTQHFGYDFRNKKVREALRRAADGYAQNYNFKGSVQILYGNNNNMDQDTRNNANAAGGAQAHATKVLNNYQRHRAKNSRLPYGKEDAAVGGDIEPGWALSAEGAAAAKHLVNGAAKGGGGPYFNDGTANLSGDTNRWTVGDLCEVSFTVNGHRTAIPEIYHPEQIDDWEHVRRNCHSQQWYYAGVVWAKEWSEYSSPRKEWKALARHSPARVHHQVLNFVNVPH